MTQATSTRVLLVEDEFDDAMAVKRSLRPTQGAAERYALAHASTLAQGIAHLRQAPVDVLLLDLRLPDSDGPGTVAQLRARDSRVPMVVFTGTSDPDVAARAIEAGADEYLVKSDLRDGVLRETLRHAIERRRRISPPETPSQRDPRDTQRILLHELKSLHTSILGNARIIQREIRERGFLRQRADALLGAARTAGDLIQRICASAEEVEDTTRLLALSALVLRTEPLLRAVLPVGVHLSLDLASDPVLVPACAESLRRVLLELVVNAAEAIGEVGGRIEVQTGHVQLAASEIAKIRAPGEFAPGPHAWLEVRDDGAGMDASTHARLPEPGFSTKGAGRGRGLELVRDTLARHRAGLRVESRPTEGTAFRIFLPARS